MCFQIFSEKKILKCDIYHQVIVHIRSVSCLFVDIPLSLECMKARITSGANAS